MYAYSPVLNYLYLGISFMLKNILVCTEVLMILNYLFRKGLAPHLKSLMGPWWYSQFDPVPEVSLAARQSLEV